MRTPLTLLVPTTYFLHPESSPPKHSTRTDTLLDACRDELAVPAVVPLADFGPPVGLVEDPTRYGLPPVTIAVTLILEHPDVVVAPS